MKTRLDKTLDVLHTFSSALATVTQRRRQRRRLRRHHIIGAVNVASALASAVSMALPQARPAAAALGALQKTVPAAVPADEDPQTYVPKAEQSLLVRLQTIEELLPQTAGEYRTRLEAQRDLLLKLIEDYERNRG